MYNTIYKNSLDPSVNSHYWIFNSKVYVLLLSLVGMTPEMKWEVNLIELMSVPQNFGIHLTYSSYVFSLLILFITYNIFKFSKFYMINSQFFKLFSCILFIFSLSMILLLVSNSLLMLFISWEFLGVSSWFLILFYFSWNSFQGSFLTMFINRMGDSFLLFSFLFLYHKYSWMNIMVLFLMMVTKSSQFPFISWLPAAMAAPTPVSALVHSSTLVTAGLVLVIRFKLPMGESVLVKMMSWFGLMTMVLGSYMACISADLKKLVAFSTLSQLGFMMSLSSMLWQGMMMFHLMTHAIAKSFLFMVCGMIMLSMNSQSVLSTYLNLSGSVVSSLVSIITLNFLNVSFMMMWFSKEMSMMNYNYLTLLYMVMVSLYFIFTLLYSLRFFMIVMIKKALKPTFILIKYKFKFTFYLNFILMMLFSYFYLMHVINLNMLNLNYKMSLMGLILWIKFYKNFKIMLWSIILSLNVKLLNLWKFLIKIKEDFIMLNYLTSLFNLYKMMSNSFYFMIMTYIFFI